MIVTDDMGALDEGAEQTKCTPLDKIVEMASKEIDAISNISDVTFKDFFRSRIIKTDAISAPRYFAKVATKVALLPAYYAAFKLYQFGDGLPEGE